MSQKCILFARIGTSPMCDDLFIDGQLKILRFHAEQRGWSVECAVTEQGIGALDPWRVGTIELVQMVKEHQVDYVLVMNYNRLSRTVDGLIKIAQELEKYGTKIVSVNEGELNTSELLAFYQRIETFDLFKAGDDVGQ